MTTIYIASKAYHGPKWQKLREEGYPIVAGWIDFGGPETIPDWAVHWDMCIREAAKADYCIVYWEEGDKLKGALTEMGASLAAGKQVLFVGDPDKKKYTQARHPNVKRFDTMEEALDFIVQKPKTMADWVLQGARAKYVTD